MCPAAWELGDSNPKLLIGIPHKNLVTLSWALSFRNLQVNVPSIFTCSSGVPVDIARSEIVKSALNNNVDWIFFIDCDVECPPDTISRLMSHNLPIVTGIYFTRNYPLEPAIWKEIQPSGKQSIPFTPGTGLIECDFIGAGCLLTHTSVFKNISPPYFSWTLGREVPGDMTRGRSEDFEFCKKARERGYRIFADTGIICKHEIANAFSNNQGIQISQI